MPVLGVREYSLHPRPPDKSLPAVGGRQQLFYAPLRLDAEVGEWLGPGYLLSAKGARTLS